MLRGILVNCFIIGRNGVNPFDIDGSYNLDGYVIVPKERIDPKEFDRLFPQPPPLLRIICDLGGEKK